MHNVLNQECQVQMRRSSLLYRAISYYSELFSSLSSLISFNPVIHDLLDSVLNTLTLNFHPRPIFFTHMNNRIRSNTHTDPQYLHYKLLINKLLRKLWPCDHGHTRTHGFQSRVPTTMCQETSNRRMRQD
ncbi:hypothetical protein HanRHA438_Chr13g0596141 [Helianthus annuus]|nr:hypothetical protein HanIR_Chr13g0637461 [Helianthus annuus]KAJ0857980.1 hypothetical protein HanRHA438_Chr13g0596141 [Helianthus annuus]